MKGLCEGKSHCRVAPTDQLFGNAVKCTGWKRMWITYSCDGGTDKTTKETPKQATTTPRPPTCPSKHGEMRSHDIPLQRGWINIRCVAAGGDRRKRQASSMPMMMPCIYIHKVRAACNSGGGTIQKQMDLVSWIYSSVFIHKVRARW